MSPATAADPAGPAADPVARLVGFGRFLRREGFPVGPGRVLTFVRAAGVLSPLGRQELYWAARASLISRSDLIDPFDRAFDAYFGGEVPGEREVLLPDPDRTPRSPEEPDAAGFGEEAAVSASRWTPAEEDEEAEERSAIRIVAADTETLRNRSFEELSEEERARTNALIRQIAVRAARRRTRRLRPAADGNRFDLRRTLRRSLRTEGEPFRRAWRGRRTRLRPLVLILDVSGSMGPFARALLQFAFAAMAAGGRVEVFCFGTQLTRVTRSLRTKDPDRALREVGRLVRDWEGGTRIGDSLKALLDGWSQRTALRGAVVVLCSDGLERGDPAVLRTQMGRLSRLAHRVVWVNPLKGSPRYEPLARGMAGALPFVDEFLPGHNLQSLEELARAVAR
jgi:uncharacterized protein